MKTTEEMIAVMQHYVDGGSVEYEYAKGKWCDNPFPTWCWGNVPYRIAVTKPSVNWDHVHPDYNWLARDQNGKCYVFEVRPERDDDTWWTTSEYANATVYASLTP